MTNTTNTSTANYVLGDPGLRTSSSLNTRLEGVTFDDALRAARELSRTEQTPILIRRMKRELFANRNRTWSQEVLDAEVALCVPDFYLLPSATTTSTYPTES